jgi:hypothetical protein
MIVVGNTDEPVDGTASSWPEVDEQINPGLVLP